MPHRAPPGVLTLYGDSRSGNCLKVKWTAERRGVNYRWVEIDVVAGETRTDGFLSINPAGQAPCAILPDRKSVV